MYNAGQSSTYLTLFDDLVATIPARGLETVTPVAGGSLYVVGDILGIDGTGGTPTTLSQGDQLAQLEVVSVDGGGAITALRIYRAGVYDVDPTTLAGNSLTGGTGSGATANLAFAASGWTLLRRTVESSSTVVVDTPGNGYNVGDVLELVGGIQGVGANAATEVTVSTTTGGPGTGVASVTVNVPGFYEVAPPSPGTTNALTGSGAGCELSPVYVPSILRNESVAMFQGTNPGGDAPIFGFHAYQTQDANNADTVFNFALVAVTSYAPGLRMSQQPNVSPGLNFATGQVLVNDNQGAFVPYKLLDGAADISYEISVQPRRVVCMARVPSPTTTHVAQWWAGLVDQLGTQSEFQYPMAVIGSTNRANVRYDDVASPISGISELVGITTPAGHSGPGFLWYPEGLEWISLRNANVSSDFDTSPTSSPGSAGNGIYPGFFGAGIPGALQEDQIVAEGAGVNWRDVWWGLGSGYELFPTPDSSEVLPDGLNPLTPLAIIRRDTAASPDVFSFIGRLDGLFWASAANGEATGSRVPVGSDRYKYWQNGNRVESYSFLALRED